MIRQELTELVAAAVRQAQAVGALPEMELPSSPPEHPQNPEHGDYASSLPLKLARGARMSPIAIAEVIRGSIAAHPAVQEVAIAPPGFVNFTLNQEWLSQQVEDILQAGERYGTVDVGQGQSIQVEFVSANPTGPLHVGHGRGAVLGSSISNILDAAGYKVTREYYVNDTGNQIAVFQHSLWARYLQALGQDVPFPENGYGGAYLVDLAQELAAERGGEFLGEPETEKRAALAKLGMERMISLIRRDLEDLRTTFDVWYSEVSLYQDGTYQKCMELLARGAHVAEREGARWFVSTALGEDKDNVLVRTTGVPTYFASDAAYHYNKFVQRGFSRVINIWGADHQGHVSRVKAIVAALGVNSSRLEVLLSQLVTLRRGAEIVRLSKRAGDIIALRDVLDEVGADACRFFFLSRSADSQMDFDLELAKKQSSENPVYYVQYAHARIASVLRNAQERGITWDEGEVALLRDEAELALVRKMLLLPELVETAALNLAPHSLPHFALELATAFHNFYERCRIISDAEPEMTRARLKLAQAAKTVLANTLILMGMTAPEQM